MSTFKRPESVLVVVHSTDGHILMLRRADVPGFWQSVTGSLLPGETPLQAARRELQEETGFDPAAIEDCGRQRRFPIAPAWRERFAPDVTHNIEHEFHLRLDVPTEPDLSSGEHVEARWCPFDQALELASSWTNRAAIRRLPVDPSRAAVILVHGLWVGRLSMALLAARLRRAGFIVRLFGYRSTRETPAAAAQRLARAGTGVGRPVVHFVSHSLGGIVLAHRFEREAGGHVGRALLLGPPMQDSVAARRLRQLGLDWALGASRRRGLLGGRPEWNREVPVAVIAGTRPLGLARLVARIPRPHDGVVNVSETVVAGAARAVMPVSHFGLVISRAVTERTIAWLREGVLPGDQS